MSDFYKTTRIYCSYTFLQFAIHEQSRLWSGTDDHRKRSVIKATKFSNFGENANRQLLDYRPAHIHAFFDRLEARGVSANTINHYGAMVAKVFRQAAREGLIEAVPLFTWKKVKGNKRPMYYTYGQLCQIDAYFNDAHPHSYMRHFCVIAAQTGMRLGEILKINQQTLVDVDGKPCVYLETTKNGEERLVPLTGQAREAVRALGDNPARHWTHRSFYDGLKAMRCRLFNGDKRYCFHTFRHTAATHLAAADRSTAMIALLMGHKSEATTRKYIKPKPSALRGLVDMLEQQ